MLLYILFCLLLVVQAHSNCRVRETIQLTNMLLGRKFEDCACNETNHNSCLCLPIPKNACLKCFVEPNQGIQEKLSTMGSEGRRLYRYLQQVQHWCTPLFPCNEICEASPGNVINFLTSVRAALQKLERQ